MGQDASADQERAESSHEGGGARFFLGFAPAAALIAVALWEVVAAGRAGAEVPGEEAWAAASAALRSRHRDGDLIVFAPGWIDPVGREHLGDLMPLDMAGRMDDARYGRMFEVSIRGARARESEGRQEVWSEDFGGVRVRTLVRERARVVTDFVAALAGDRRAAVVEGRALGGVRVGLQEVGFEPRRCIRVVPQPDQTVRVVFPSARLGGSLVGAMGLADVFTRRDHREPGRLQVFVDDDEVASVEVGVDDGWVGFEAKTEPRDGARVVFAATAVGPDARERNICFAAEARE